MQVRFFFAYNHRDESPSELMDKVRAVERRDRERGDACFMTLVVPMLTSVGSLVTRKQLVADLYTEVLAGQGYLLSALGCISAPLVDVRRLEEVLDRLEPLMSLPGGFLRLAWQADGQRHHLGAVGTRAKQMWANTPKGVGKGTSKSTGSMICSCRRRWVMRSSTLMTGKPCSRAQARA